MRIVASAAAALAAVALTAGAQPGPERPLTALPYSPSLDTTIMNRSADPCDDLFEYACGNWEKVNPMPPEETYWSVYIKLSTQIERYLWGILEEDSAAGPTRAPNVQKIGDYFAACMNVEAIEHAGASPLKADLERIAALSSKHELAALIGDLHTRTHGSGVLFASGVEQDTRDATRVIASIDSGGLGLPDRDYYLRRDAHSVQIRAQYVEHIARMFALLGEAETAAQRDAATVMRIELALARPTLTMVQRRDPERVYHRTTAAALSEIAPAFNWSEYFAHSGLTPVPWVNLSEPRFTRELNARLVHERLADIKVYLRWALIAASAPYLSANFVQEDFRFMHATLLGQKIDRPRWQKCVRWVDRDLGEALGQEFVARVFPPTAKAATVRMTQQIEAAMQRRIRELKWMSPATREQALKKLAAISNKIGYPQRWRDYSTLSIAGADFFGNVTRAASFESHRQAAKIGAPVDREEWDMTPATVDAYFDPQLNMINFPAAVLLPPLFDPRMDDAPNYGNTGGTIGHELTHAFDDRGRQYDGAGNLRDWWTGSDAKAFEQRAQCIRDQYSQYPIADDLKVDGQLTAGENIADLGGEILGYLAWQEQVHGQTPPSGDGLTPDQRFFVGFAQWACGVERPERARLDAVVDPHAPQRYRVNGVVVNMPEFARAFHCRADQALVKPESKICRIW